MGRIATGKKEARTGDAELDCLINEEDEDLFKLQGKGGWTTYKVWNPQGW